MSHRGPAVRFTGGHPWLFEVEAGHPTLQRLRVFLAHFSQRTQPVNLIDKAPDGALSQTTENCACFMFRSTNSSQR
jgi:hypothetical protein